MRVLSLFSGIGGFDLGFERSGMEVIAMCEIDKHCQQVLSKHFPKATLYTDVTEVVFEEGTVDLICGGFPCQDLSVAGKRKGLSGERSGLWREFERIIKLARPKWVVIENVPGLLSSNGGRDFTVIIQSLAQLGYGVGWRVLDSQGFGLAQRRKRVFIVGSLGNPSACTVLLESESLQGDNKPVAQKRKDNSRTSIDATEREGRRAVAWKYRSSNGVCTGERGGTVGALGGTGYMESSKAFTVDTVLDQYLWEATHVDDPVRICTDQTVSPTLQARMGTGGNSTPLIGIRKLTPTECERLQGFPDGWTEGHLTSQRYKQLGNAVSVPVAEWIGNKIMGVSNGQ